VIKIKLSKLTEYTLKKITRKIVWQGGHKQRIIRYYQILTEAAREEFMEDNKVTLDDFLSECHGESLNDKN
jgi:hypothetical protein